MIPLWLWLAYTGSASMTAYFMYRLGVEHGYDNGYKDAINDDYYFEDYYNDRPFNQFETRDREQNIAAPIYGGHTGYL